MNDYELIDGVMKSLGAIYPSWFQASKDKDVRYVWARAINRAGLTSDQIKKGVIHAETEGGTFPPSTGDFIRWCKGDNGLPTKHQAWQIASSVQSTSQIKSPEVVEAVNRTKHFDIKNRDEKTMKPLFFDHYADVLRERAEGAHFALPAPQSNTSQTKVEQTEEDRAKGREVLDKLLADLDEGMKP